MQPEHSLLRRQLRRLRIETENGIPQPWRDLISDVDVAYRAADEDRAVLERTLDLTSEELLQANADIVGMVQAFPDCFLRLRHDGTILDRRGGPATSRHELPAVGQLIQDIAVPGVGGRLMTALAGVTTTGSAASLEYSLHPQGPHREARLVPLPTGDVGLLLRDITERRRAECEREESLAVFRSLIDNMSAGVLIETPSRTTFAVNLAYCRTFGLPEAPEDLVGRDCRAQAEDGSRLVADAGSFPGRVEEILRAGVAIAGEEVLFADGRVFERDYVPISLSGRLLGHMWQYRDVTEPRTLQKQLIQAQKMEAIGGLAAGVAHDFNNLLTTILCSGEMVAEEVDDERLKLHLRGILAAAERAATLTRQLLAFGRKQMLQPRVIEVNTAVQGLRPMLVRLMGEDVVVTTRLAAALGKVWADPGQLEQVIVNLALNSRDAMAAGGVLEISTLDLDLRKPLSGERRVMPPGRYVLLTVRDAGCGMDEATRRRVFEPFFTTKEVGRGTGLGLASVYGIVKQSSGFIWVTSAPGVGTSFDLYLPVVAQEPAVDPPRRSAPSRAVEGGTILLLEDEDDLRCLISEVLARAGYDVLTARTGAEALQIAAEDATEIHLLLSDIVLPDSPGPTVAATMRRRRPQIRVLFISGWAGEDLLRRGVLDRGLPLLPKPFTPESLLEHVARRMAEPAPAVPDDPEEQAATLAV